MEPKVIFIIILIVLASIVMIQNTDPVNIKILLWTISMSRVLLILICLLIGFGIGYVMAKLKGSSS